MDYFSTIQAVYISGTVLSLNLLFLIAWRSRKSFWAFSLLPGIVGQLIWLAPELTGALEIRSTQVLLMTEVFRFAGWAVSVFLIYRKLHPSYDWPLAIKSAFVISALLALFFPALLFLTNAPSAALSLILSLQAIVLILVMEQCLRFEISNRALKITALTLAVAFTIDALNYVLFTISVSPPLALTYIRAGYSVLLTVILSFSLLLFDKNERGKVELRLSQPVAYHLTLSLIAILAASAIIYSTILASMTNTLLSLLIHMLSTLILLTFLSLALSRSFRLQTRVFVNKTFFRLKYDYRKEWLKTTTGIASLNFDQPAFHQQILSVFKDILHIQQGSIWIKQNSHFKEAHTDFQRSHADQTVNVNDEFIKTMIKQSWIYAVKSNNRQLQQHSNTLPEWIRTEEEYCLVVPLMTNMKILGFVILSEPLTGPDLSFEELDLLHNVSTQISSYLMLKEQDALLTEASKIHTYQRLSTFIIHDINNIVAQLSLVTKNAEKHRDNPAFVQDAMNTVANASSKMRDLLNKLNPSHQENRTKLAINPLLEKVAGDCEQYQPKPILSLGNNFHVDADKDRLAFAIKNLVRNAQEATENSGSVKITTFNREEKNHLWVEDDGSGMSTEFIQEELFKPFKSTKLKSGIGIGAYLTKSYIEQIGADINVTSKQGVGTRFEIVFA